VGSAGEQVQGFGEVGVVSCGEVLGGAGEVVVGGDADAVDEFVVGCEFVAGGEGQDAVVVEDVWCCRPGDDTAGPSAERVAGGHAVAVCEHQQR
jgi:hypothetical protein